MKKISILVIIVCITTLGINLNVNKQSKVMDVQLENVIAMASSGEGTVIDPNDAAHCHLTERKDENGKMIARCCIRRCYEDHCNYRLQKGDCRGPW